MDKWRINAYTLEYDDSTHTYLVDGVIVPSVTQVLKELYFNELYKYVSYETLQRASEKGTYLHEAIENYCKGNKQLRGIEEVRDFEFLMQYYGLEVMENETPVIIVDDGTPVMAGRLDLILNSATGRAVADIKTTSILNKSYLAYQLNLYRLGYMQSYGAEITKLYAIHLKNGHRKLIEMPCDVALARVVIKDWRTRHE